MYEIYNHCLAVQRGRVLVAINEQPCASVSTDETTTAGPETPGTGRGLVFHAFSAEGVGFEPTSRGHLLAVFKTAAIGH